ncbi:Uncharacterized protein dnm_006070 [Desulfonema magnum]|uniref:Uncharacterized protein n=1 Tax=Desulfonema magnum TaxID=45655 RepID=A0A975BG03_9BACT|nr:Uncharacterized protein dnm_006070 [Desulfonema magnum]
METTFFRIIILFQCYKYAALTGLVGMPANLPLQICRPYGAWSAYASG